MNEAKHITETIKEHFESGGVIMLRTAWKNTLVKANKAYLITRPKDLKDTGLYVQHGKSKLYYFAYQVAFGRYKIVTKEN